MYPLFLQMILIYTHHSIHLMVLLLILVVPIDDHLVKRGYGTANVTNTKYNGLNQHIDDFLILLQKLKLIIKNNIFMKIFIIMYYLQ